MKMNPLHPTPKRRVYQTNKVTVDSIQNNYRNKTGITGAQQHRT